jgi:hypothetical protein
VPAELTKLLGCEPTKAHQKGDVLPDKRYHRVASTGSWLLNGTKPELTDIEEQIGALLSLVTQEIEVWRRLTGEFDADVFCGIFLEDCNRGFSLSPDITAKLSQRGLEIGFDIYSP